MQVCTHKCFSDSKTICCRHIRVVGSVWKPCPGRLRSVPMLICVVNLITLRVLTHIFTLITSVEIAFVCLFHTYVPSWTGALLCCCFSSHSLPQRLVVWPAQSCCCGLEVVSLLLVSLNLKLLPSPCEFPRVLYVTVCLLGQGSFFLSCLRGPCPGCCWLWKVLWRGPACQHLRRGSTLFVACDTQCFCNPSKKRSKVLETAQFWRGKCALCLSGSLVSVTPAAVREGILWQWTTVIGAAC